MHDESWICGELTVALPGVIRFKGTSIALVSSIIEVIGNIKELV